MILRKPYAFLMKHFRKINFALFLLAVYVFSFTLKLLGYLGDYANGNTNDVDLIMAMFSSTFFLAVIFIIAITLILLFLLKRKDKPIKTYIFIFIEYVLVLILGIYLNGYFHDFFLNGYDRAMAKTIQGLASVLSYPQYPILLLLVIRFMGLDLNSFGFRQDQELLASEEDREEVEVEVGFDKDRFKRKLRMYWRNILYFLEEKKVYVLIVLSVVVVIASFFTYRYFYVTHRVYKMNQTVSSNYYQFQVHHSYITTRDYRGDELAKGKSYVIIDLDVKNTLQNTRTLDIRKFLLYVDDDYYAPTTNFNNRFEDLGPVFKNQSLEGKASDNYYLIYEIDTPKKNSEFLLRYQDVVGSPRLIRVKLQIQDISSFVLKDTKSIQEDMEVVVNKEDTKKFKITSYEIGERYPYTYEQCSINNCPIYGGYTEPKAGRSILYMRVQPYQSSTQDLLSMFIRYGTIRYTIGDSTYQEKVKSHVVKVYKGNFFYFETSSSIQDATSIEILLTIRNNQYIYKIK